MNPPLNPMMRFLITIFVLLVPASCARRNPLDQLVAAASKNVDGNEVSRNAAEFLRTNKVAGILSRDAYPQFIWTVSRGVGCPPTSVVILPGEMISVNCVDFGGTAFRGGFRIYSDEAISNISVPDGMQMVLWTNNLYFYTAP